MESQRRLQRRTKLKPRWNLHFRSAEKPRFWHPGYILVPRLKDCPAVSLAILGMYIPPWLWFREGGQGLAVDIVIGEGN